MQEMGLLNKMGTRQENSYVSLAQAAAIGYSLRMCDDLYEVHRGIITYWKPTILLHVQGQVRGKCDGSTLSERKRQSTDPACPPARLPAIAPSAPAGL